MVGTIKQITDTLTALEQQVTELGQAFYDTYSSYLDALGKAARQQLIMASYQVCTEGYPEAFLKLSMSQRQDLQQALRQLTQQTQADFLALLKSPDAAFDGEPPGELSTSDRQPDVTESDEKSFDNELDFLLSAMHKQKPAPPANALERLIQWQGHLEKAIAETLQTTTHAGNRFLQQARILPHNLPEPLLEAAAKSAPPEAIAGNPNVLDLLVEAVGNSSADQPSTQGNARGKPREGGIVLHLVAINLRLAELEFADSAVMVWRNKLRDLSKRLQALGQAYQKTQREKAIAEAQMAWRATWTND